MASRTFLSNLSPSCFDLTTGTTTDSALLPPPSFCLFFPPRPPLLVGGCWQIHLPAHSPPVYSVIHLPAHSPPVGAGGRRPEPVGDPDGLSLYYSIIYASRFANQNTTGI